jgi:hypothetical protein
MEDLSIDNTPGNFKKMKHDLGRLDPVMFALVKNPKKRLCDRWLVHPNSKLKMRFDFLIIVFAVWNSVLVPYEAAYGNLGNSVVSVID